MAEFESSAPSSFILLFVAGLGMKAPTLVSEHDVPISSSTVWPRKTSLTAITGFTFVDTDNLLFRST